MSNTKTGVSVTETASRGTTSERYDEQLGKAAADVLRALPHHRKGQAVFGTGDDGAPYQGLPKAWERIAKRAKLRGVTLHTLRHSFATTANTMGLSEAAIAGMLGHARGSVTARYAHNVDEVLLTAADRVAAAIAHALAGRRSAEVVKLERAAARGRYRSFPWGRSPDNQC